LFKQHAEPRVLDSHGHPSETEGANSRESPQLHKLADDKSFSDYTLALLIGGSIFVA
jgi:hypothetical protein